MKSKGLVNVDNRPPRIAYMCSRDNTYVQSQWAAWQMGGIAVPIAENYPASEIAYVLKDCGASFVLADSAKFPLISQVAAEMKLPLVEVPRMAPCKSDLSSRESTAIPAPPYPGGDCWSENGGGGALMVYTSGTTGRPKGVLTSHKGLVRQITALTEAWGWVSSDHTYSVLPLHHVHGIVAILNSSVWSGAVCEIPPRFQAADTWEALTRPPGSPKGQITVFMAVPTVYSKLLEYYDAQSTQRQSQLSAALRPPHSRIRLMVSGSAALPQSVAERWREVSGHTLLERYGPWRVRAKRVEDKPLLTHTHTHTHKKQPTSIPPHPQV